MVKYCLDTDVVIEYLKDKNSVAAKFVLKFRDEIAITAVTLYELYYGPMKIGLTKEIRDIESLEKQIIVIPLNANAARKAAEIDAELHKIGKPVGLRDIFIASIALTNNLVIITRNLQDFNKIRNVEEKLVVATPDDIINAQKGN